MMIGKVYRHVLVWIAGWSWAGVLVHSGFPAWGESPHPSDEQGTPRSIRQLPTDFWDLTLHEAIAIALQRSDVFRDLGGRVLSQPEGVATRFDVAVEATDPNFGVAAALSEFDAQLSSQFTHQNNDRVFNNFTLGAGAQELRQDFTTWQTQLSKTAVTGTQFGVRSITGYDANNRLGNRFPSIWESQYEAEVRQPLLQGAGVSFNRIAGPNGRPGLRYGNGIVIAQMNQKVSQLDFEIAVQSLVSEIIDTYWRLYQGYQNYATKSETLKTAERIWKGTEAKFKAGIGGTEADKEAQARAQYYLYQDLAIEALNGSARTPGVYEAERQLRHLLGLPINDGRLIRPHDLEPDAQIIHDWWHLQTRATTTRAEIRKQTVRVKQEELRLCASKNFVLPRLDARALYRLRGFGDDLTGSGARFSSAAQDLGRFDHQEWEFGLQFDVPLGQRRALAGVRHAQLRLARERAVLREQVAAIEHDLAQSVSRAEQAHASLMASKDRVIAARNRVDATEVAYEAGKSTLDLLLDAQERLDLAEDRYFDLLTGYVLANKDVSLHAGDLLREYGIVVQGDVAVVSPADQPRRRDVLDYRCMSRNSTPTMSSEIDRVPTDSCGTNAESSQSNAGPSLGATDNSIEIDPAETEATSAATAKMEVPILADVADKLAPVSRSLPVIIERLPIEASTEVHDEKPAARKPALSRSSSRQGYRIERLISVDTEAKTDTPASPRMSRLPSVE